MSDIMWLALSSVVYFVVLLVTCTHLYFKNRLLLFAKAANASPCCFNIWYNISIWLVITINSIKEDPK